MFQLKQRLLKCQIIQTGLIFMALVFYWNWIYNEFICREFSFVDNMQYMDGVKIGVLTGSLLSTLFGYFLILLTPNNFINEKK